MQLTACNDPYVFVKPRAVSALDAPARRARPSFQSILRGLDQCLSGLRRVVNARSLRNSVTVINNNARCAARGGERHSGCVDGRKASRNVQPHHASGSSTASRRRTMVRDSNEKEVLRQRWVVKLRNRRRVRCASR